MSMDPGSEIRIQVCSTARWREGAGKNEDENFFCSTKEETNIKVFFCKKEKPRCT